MKLIYRISITIIFLMLVFLSSAIFIISNFTSKVLEKSISITQGQITRELMLRIDTVIYERKLDIEDFSRSTIIENYFNKLSTEADVQRRLDSFLATSGPWNILKLVDENGNVIFSSNKNLINSKISSKNNVKIAYDAAFSGEIFVSDLELSEDTGLPTIYFSAPVRITNKDLTKRTIGVAIGQFSWSTIEKIISSENLSNTYINLISSRNIILATNTADNTFVKKQAFIFDKSNITKIDNLNYISEINSHHPFRALITTAMQTGFQTYLGNGWQLIIESPTKEVFLPVTQNTRQVIILYSILVAIVIFVMILLIKKVFLDPLNNLSSVANKIANGDFKKRAEENSFDEIGQLGKDFNIMVNELIAAKEGVEQKVQERTSELEKINHFMINRELKLIEMKKTVSNLNALLKK